MENFYNSPDEENEGTDPHKEAQHFEQRLETEESFFMDLITLEEVYDYYRIMNETDKALALLNFAISHYPYNADFYYKKAGLALELEDFPHAQDLIADALAIRPFDENFLILKAKIQNGLGQFDEAVATMQATIELTDENSEAYYQLGQLCQNEGHLHDAIKNYSLAITADAEYEDALFEIVYCFETLDELQEGITYCEEFLAAHPYSACGWYNLGTLQQKAGYYEQAIISFDYALIIQEEFISAYYGKAGALMELQRYDESIRILLQSLSYDRNDIATLLALGECYEQIMDYSRARFYYAKCTELYANLPDAQYGIASSYEAENRYLEAIHYYKKAIELNQDYFDAWAGLADCEYFLGNAVSAYEALRKAILLCPQDVELWKVWAERFSDDGSLDVALDLLEEGIGHNAGSVELLYQYAAYALNAGKSREALTYLENALTLDHEKHFLLYRWSPRAEGQRQISTLIEQYRLPR